ncbi:MULTISPECIES: hypothetical protein [unclassified Janthinobacterium]|uniref:hypothetical protein n=1 Tax=unclassified Janthinobacterium TaxID=2610881 RepID=UPI000875A2DD|nr:MULTISPECIES: hypothetical protein [unclassified Janthinobacterium]
MNIKEYENLPDGLHPLTVWEHTRIALIESEGEDKFLTLRKLRELAHHQWHTYEIPPSGLRDHLQRWLQEHWQHSYQFIESVLLIAYSFCLNKGIYSKALEEFPGAFSLSEQDLEQSAGESMNPWWSLAPKVK